MTSRIDPGRHKPPPRVRAGMYLPLQETVNAGAIDAGSWVVCIASLAVTAGWLAYLYR